jgi:hypothetical protein
VSTLLNREGQHHVVLQIFISTDLKRSHSELSELFDVSFLKTSLGIDIGKTATECLIVLQNAVETRK